jgi:hypothetical protein
MMRNPDQPRTPRRLAGLLLAAGFLLAASGGSKAAVTLIQKETVIRDLSSSGLVLSFQVGIANDGTAEKRLVRTRYKVLVNRREFLDMDVALDEPLAVPAGGELLVALPVKITYALLFRTVGPVEDRAACDAVGEMFFDTGRRREERAPFAFSAEFPIFKDPELVFLPLQVNSATLGGADLLFRPKFRNVLGYDLLVDRIRFRLLLDGREVLAGEILGDKSIPRSGERVFDLSFLVDFFDLGPELRSKFEGGVLPFRLVGELDIASAWGKIVVPFDKSDDVAVEKKP